MKVTLDTGAEITLNADYTTNPSKCRSCGAKIFWGKTINDKFMPLNEDLKTSHYSSCPEANNWRKPKTKEIKRLPPFKE